MLTHCGLSTKSNVTTGDQLLSYSQWPSLYDQPAATLVKSPQSLSKGHCLCSPVARQLIDLYYTCNHSCITAVLSAPGHLHLASVISVDLQLPISSHQWSSCPTMRRDYYSSDTCDNPLRISQFTQVQLSICSSSSGFN